MPRGLGVNAWLVAFAATGILDFLAVQNLVVAPGTTYTLRPTQTNVIDGGYAPRGPTN